MFATLPDPAQAATLESVAATAVVAPQLGPLAPAYLAEVRRVPRRTRLGCLVAAAVAAVGAVVVLRFLPAQAAATEPPDADAAVAVDLA